MEPDTTKNNKQLDEKLSSLEKRFSVLEFIIALAFSLCLVLIYAIVKIQNITFYSSPIIYYGLLFFTLSFLSIEFILYLARVVEKVGTNLKNIAGEWKTEKTLNKILIILGLPSTLYSFYALVRWIVGFIGDFLMLS